VAEETLGQRLLRLLNEQHYGKSESAWAREAGVDFYTLRRTVNDESVPRYPTMVKLAAYVGVSYEYLLTGEGQQDPPPVDVDDIRARVDEAMALLQSIARDLDARDGKL
jgi:transcriptional regulator with XRE-family HTH domain